MRLNAHFDMLPERAFQKRGFGSAPATLEGGKGGGGGGPTQTTAYQTNVPEYAKPYVMNMLGAAQNQLFTTEGGDITGFRPYQAYSSNPQDYFAGPSSLQQGVYNEAGQLQTPGQFAPATGLAGIAGQQALGTQSQSQGLMNTALDYGQAGAGFGQVGQMYGSQGAQQANTAAQQAQRAAQMYGRQGSIYGAQAAGLAPQAQAYGQGAANIGMQGLGFGAQGAGFGQQAANMAGMGFGAGQQYAQQVTDPNAVGAYMSPYQQAVTDVAKNAAVREAQLAGQQANLGAARQGTYGGARQALMGAEREKNLLANLSNIQAQGSQAAYDKAIQSQQFGANLGLQGLGAGYQGLGMGIQGAQAGLSGLGTAMQGQQAGLSGLSQAGSLYGQGMQGAGVGLSGVGQQLGAGQLGLQGTAQGIQGAQAGMQGAGVGLSGVGQALGAGQYGLQGLGQATQAASTLGQLGTAEQQADLARLGFQQQTGQQQQQYQQNIINQAIQDYATAQQYPYMQLSTMSNLLRGLPMQSMSTQQYQAQPSALQQGIGLLGTGASLYGAMGRKEGGTIKEYKAGGEVKGLGYTNRGQVDSMRDRLEEMFATDPEDTAKYVAQSASPSVKKLARELGITTASTGKLGTNMAGGGIVAFGGGGDVPGYYDGDLIDGFGASPESIAMDQLRVDEAKLAADRKRYEQIKAMSPVAAEKMLAENPNLEVRAPVVAASPTAPAEKKDNVTPAAAPAAAPANANQSVPGSQETGIAAQLALREKFLGERGAGGAMGEEARGLMDYIKAGKERRESEAGRDRYLRMADAFAQFGSTPGPFMGSAAKALGGFAKGEAAAQKELRAADFADKKMAVEIEKGQRLEARGDFDAAQKAYDNAEIIRERRDSSIRQAEATLSAASRPGERERIAKRLIEENPKMSMEQALSRATDLMSTSDESKQADLVKAAYTEAAKSVAPGGSNYSQYKKLQEKDPEAAKRFVTELAQRQYQGMRDAMSTITGAKPGSGGNIDKSNPLLKG